MNDNNLNNSNNSNVNTYKATTNLNTAIENPQINVNSAVSVNMKDSEYNNYADNTINNSNSGLLNNSYNVQNNNINNGVSNNSVNVNANINNVGLANESLNQNNTEVNSNQNTGSYSYEPVMTEKKVAKNNGISSLLHSKEFKVIIFIMFILCLFLLVIPYVYDFFTKLKMIRIT